MKFPLSLSTLLAIASRILVVEDSTDTVNGSCPATRARVGGEDKLIYRHASDTENQEITYYVEQQVEFVMGEEANGFVSIVDLRGQEYTLRVYVAMDALMQVLLKQAESALHQEDLSLTVKTRGYLPLLSNSQQLRFFPCPTGAAALDHRLPPGALEEFQSFFLGLLDNQVLETASRVSNANHRSIFRTSRAGTGTDRPVGVRQMAIPHVAFERISTARALALASKDCFLMRISLAFTSPDQRTMRLFEMVLAQSLIVEVDNTGMIITRIVKDYQANSQVFAMTEIGQVLALANLLGVMQLSKSDGSFVMDISAADAAVRDDAGAVTKSRKAVVMEVRGKVPTSLPQGNRFVNVIETQGNNKNFVVNYFEEEPVSAATPYAIAEVVKKSETFPVRNIFTAAECIYDWLACEPAVMRAVDAMRKKTEAVKASGEQANRETGNRSTKAAAKASGGKATDTKPTAATPAPSNELRRNVESFRDEEPFSELGHVQRGNK